MNLYKKKQQVRGRILSQNQLKVQDLADFETYLSTRFNIQTIIIDVKYPEIELIHTLEDDWNDIINM